MSNIVYGALPVYQLHFIVNLKSARNLDYNIKTRTRHKKEGSKINVYWEGGILADKLNNDKKLLEMLSKVIVECGDIFIDPIDKSISIYTKWRPEYGIILSKDAIETFNKIAKCVREYLD